MKRHKTLPKVIVSIIGPPGSGKNQVCKHLTAHIPGVYKFGMGDHCRQEIAKKTPLGQRLDVYEKNGLLAQDEDILPIASEEFTRFRHSSHRIVLADGVFRTCGQYKFAHTITCDWGYGMVTVFLDDPIGDCLARIIASASDQNNDRGDRVDNSLEIVETRMEEYNNKTVPAINLAKQLDRQHFFRVKSETLQEKLDKSLVAVSQSLASFGL